MLQQGFFVFFGLIQLNRLKIQNYQEAYLLVFKYIHAFYNTVRIHGHCHYMSPNDYKTLYQNYHIE